MHLNNNNIVYRQEINRFFRQTTGGIVAFILLGNHSRGWLINVGEKLESESIGFIEEKKTAVPVGDKPRTNNKY